MVYPYRKLHILFYSNGLAIWSGFPDITHITKIMADNLPFWPPQPSFCPNLAQLVKWINGMNFGAMHKKNVEWIALPRKFVDHKKVKVIGVTERSNVRLVKL